MEAAVVCLSVALTLVTLAAAGAIPLLWWRCDRLEHKVAEQQRCIDKLDAAMEAVLSLVHGEHK